MSDEAALDGASGTPVAYPRGAPMSPRPRMFDPPPNAPPSPPGVVKPSDLMTMEDYAKLRYSTVKRTFAGGAIGSVASVLLVRQFWPKRPSPNALVLVGFTAGIASGIYASTTHLRTEIAKVSARARALSSPTAEDGSPLLVDAMSPEVSVRPTSAPDSSADYVNQGRIHTDEPDKWGKMGVGKEGEMRDPFFRPGVPRRDG